MARRPEQALVYEAVQQFAQLCLLSDHSLLWPQRVAWTAANVAEVKRRVVDNSHTGEGNFEGKLLEQLKGASPEQWIIIADTFYVYYLPSSSITLARKQEKFAWACSQAALPPPPASVWDAQQHGFTRTSQRYNLKYSQFWLVLLFANQIKQMPDAKQILAEPQRLQETLDSVLETIPDRLSRATDMRNALLHMFFPDQYERSISTRDKMAIVETYGSRLAQPLPSDLDQSLRLIREAMGPQYSTIEHEFDFYDPQLRNEWRSGTPAIVSPLPPGAPTDAVESVAPPLASDSELASILRTLGHTRNVILYGPPGTGKTYLAGRAAQVLVGSQLQQAVPEAARLQGVAAELPFYELIALTLYRAGPTRSLLVTDLMQLPLVQARLQASPVAYPRESVWNNLQSHTSSESTTVHVTRRVEPYLFDKDVDSRWSLTGEGRAYVESELADSLSTLNPGNSGPASVVEYVVWTTFHQSYAYEDFAEGIRPQANEAGEMAYPVVPGVLRAVSQRASSQPDKKFVLVIDEINRGNIAKIFGELITLLEDDKRGILAMRLPYSGHSFTVPPNLYLIGTMNTADRGIALLDIALRRRFAFVELTPEPALLNGATVHSPGYEVALDALLSGLNSRIRRHLGSDYEIGHSYLLKVKAVPADRQVEVLDFVWNNQILPLLREYFYSQPDKLREVLAPFILDDGEVDNDAPDFSRDLGRATGEDLLFALSRLSST